MSQLQSKEFLKLQAEWDRKLAASGFRDAEARGSVVTPTAVISHDYLKSWHSEYFAKRYSPDLFKDKQEYFTRAWQFLHDYFFEDPTLEYFGIVDNEKRIWALHCEGLSIRDIVRAIQATKYRVESTITYLTRRMLGVQ